MATASEDCDAVWMDAEDPLFMLYTRYYLSKVIKNELLNNLKFETLNRQQAIDQTVVFTSGPFMIVFI